MSKMRRLLVHALAIVAATMIPATLHAQFGVIGTYGGCFGPSTTGRQFAEQLARQAAWDRENQEWFLRNGFDASIGGHTDMLDYSLQPLQAAGFTPLPSVRTFYELGNQPTFSVPMGPVVLTYRGARVRMVDGFRLQTQNDEFGHTQTVCNGSFNWLESHTGWGADFFTDPGQMNEVFPAGVYATGPMKGYLTRLPVRTWVNGTLDTCGRALARYVYRYTYHAPDGTAVAFFQRPREVPSTASFAGGCNAAAVPAPEPNFYWSSEGNASLDVSNKCRPIIRWADGSTEEFHVAMTEPTFSSVGNVTIAPPFEPSCSAADATSDLHRIDRNGNITTFRYSTSADGMRVETMIDPQGRQTVVTIDPSGAVPRLRSVDLPSIGNAPPLRYTVQWRTVTFRFNEIWPDIVCSPEASADPPCSALQSVEVVDSVTIPDGRRYVFEYGPWANLVFATEPGGVVHGYEYGDESNLDYARAALPLLNRIERDSLCDAMWSGEEIKMQARGIVAERVYPNGLGRTAIPFERFRGFSSRRLSLPGCVFDFIGAATAGPDGCSQVWTETTEPDGTVTKTGNVARALPSFIPEDDRLSIPGTVPVDVHGRQIGQETWSGETLVGAQYNGDKDSGTLWYESEFVKAVRLPIAVPASLRATKARTLLDGLTTTTNFVHGQLVDIDPGAGFEPRGTAVTSICVFAGIVNESGCSPDGPVPLIRTEMTYQHLFDGTFAGRNLLNLMTSKSVYAPDSAVPAMQSTFRYDEFPLTASGRPSSVLDPTLSRAAGTPRGNMTTSTQRVSSTKSISTTTKYFDVGTVQTVTDPMTHTVTHAPSFALCTDTATLTSTITNALGHTSTTVSDCLSDRTLRSTDANGKSTYTQYDYLGRAVETAGPGDVLTALPVNGAQPFTRDSSAPTGAGTQVGQALVTAWTEYLDSGITGRQRTVEHVRDGSPDGLYKKIFFDGLGRVVQTRAETDASKNGQGEIVMSTVFDGMGRIAQKLSACYAAPSDLKTAHCTAAGTMTSFDAIGRPTNVTEPGNRVTTHTYGQESGRWLRTTLNPRGFTTKTYTDLLGRVVEVARQSDRCVGGFCSTKASYDVTGRLLSQSDPSGNTVTYRYDDLGRRTGMTDPDLGVWSFEYDDNGNLTAQTDAKGQRISFVYDAIDRLTLKDVPPTGPSTEDVTNFYDGSGPTPPDNVAPTVTAIAPTVRETGSGAFTLTVNGNNFMSGAVVTFNGQSRQTTFVSPQQLQAAILATDVQTSGVFNVAVLNPPPGGGPSSPLPFTVNARPAVTLTSPTDGQRFSPAPAALIQLRSTVVDDTDGAAVSYYDGATLIGSSSTAPTYPVDWTNVPAGSHAVKATVTDRSAFVADSNVANILIAAAPTVSITSPQSGQTYTALATIAIAATASSAAGISKVSFFHDGVLISEDTTAPYNATWSNVPIGSYSLSATALDNNGLTTTSLGVAVTVSDAPAVGINAPQPGTVFYAPASIGIDVWATTQTDVSLGLKQIALYANGALIATASQAWTLRYTWNNVAAGSYRLTAVATNWSNVSTTSPPVDITVQTRPPNAAIFVSQSVPGSMVAGRTYDVSVTMLNNGTATWTPAASYRLGSQSPQDNLTWGTARANLSASAAPGAQATFPFTVTAPATPGSYTFRWQMVQDGVAWFGDMTASLTVTVLSAAQAAIPVNYALNRVANQTTAASGDYAADAHRAVDGNTDGNYAAGSVSMTQTYNQSFWEVPIGGPNVVNQVDIWNRTDCCSDRLSNFYVFVSRDYVMSQDPVVASQQAGVWTYHFTGAAPAHLTIPVPGVSATWVRVQLAGLGILSMAEVQVWSAPTAALTNAVQSSTLSTGDAFRATDGSNDGSSPAGSVTHTNSEVQPWWQAELSASTPINHIDVWNRTDCCSDRLTGFYVFVSDVPFTSPGLAATQSQPGVSSYYVAGTPAPVATVRVNRMGRYVRVQLGSAAANYLSLAEVQVYSGTITPPPAVSISSPANGQLFASPATIPLRATVTGGSGTATVDYYNGTTLIGSSSTAPSYAFDWTNVPPGQYVLKATVVDSNGDAAQSATVTASVKVKNDAVFVSQSVPASMITGRTYAVSVTMQNTGANTWTTASSYRLGSQNPQDTLRWGLARIAPPAAVASGGQTTFTFTVTAPTTPGTYPFQWRMVQDGVEWFGALSTNASVTVSAPPVAPSNLALGKTTAQSSTLASPSGGDPWKAVDGNTDGNFFAYTVTHTNSENQAWWQVDLGAVGLIRQLDLWNRTDCCPERLANFYVFVSDVPFTSNDPAVLKTQPAVWNAYFATQAAVRTTVPVNRTGRYVRVQLAAAGVLSLAEVQVWGTQNLSIGKPATQSTTYTNGTPTGDASRAVDGNTNGSYAAGSVTATNGDPQPWWQVDLGSVRAIERIDVWNRTDCCADRLTDFYVFVSDVPFSSTSLNTTLTQPGVWALRTPGQAALPTKLSVNRTGRYVRVQLAAGTNALSLAEVQVWGGTSIATAWDVVADYSTSRNPNAPWTFGYKSGGAFTAYDNLSTGFGAALPSWARASAPNCCPGVVKNTTGTVSQYATVPEVVQPPDVLNVHPGPAGERSTVRWTAPMTATYRIDGRVEGITTAGATTDVVITHNAATLFAANVTGYGTKFPFAITRTVLAGESIDLSVGYGSNGTYNSDSTGVALTITIDSTP